MSKQKNKANPHCPVPGCKTSKPHADDDMVRGLISMFAAPDKMAGWVCAAISELGQSMQRDWTEKKAFAWLSRLRQPEELYIRTLYALFIANEKELHHIISGDPPNGISPLYDKVNEVIFGGKGILTTMEPGLNFGSFKPMEFLHQGAHTSFAAFMTAIAVVQHPKSLPADFVERYDDHLRTYCAYLKYMEDMFKAGKSKQDVLAGVRNLHRS